MTTVISSLNRTFYFFVACKCHQMTIPKYAPLPLPTLQLKNQHQLEWLVNPVPVVTTSFARLLKYKKKKKKKETECCCPISVYLKILWKINRGWSQGKKKAHKSHVWTTATQPAFNTAASPYEVPGEIQQQSLNNTKYFLTSVIVFSCCLIFSKHSTVRIATKSGWD